MVNFYRIFFENYKHSAHGLISERETAGRELRRRRSE